MKFYKRFPDRALAGMSELNPAQRGIYNSIIDLLYSRDGMVPCMTDADDTRIAKNIAVHAQTWRVYKKQLLAIGKIRITIDGCLTANGVDQGLFDAVTHSETQAKRARNRWDNYRLANKFKARGVPRGTAINRDREISELPLPKEHAKPQNVDNGDNDESFGVVTTPNSVATSALQAVIRTKGWK